MFAAISQRYQDAADRHAEMQQKHPRVEFEEPLVIANFSIPAVKVQQGVAYCNKYGCVVEELREDYFLQLSAIGQAMGMPQIRFAHAWRRHRQNIPDWTMKHRDLWTQLLYKQPSLYIHLVMDFQPMVKDMGTRRPYHNSLNAVYCEFFPSDRISRRRKNKVVSLHTLQSKALS
ncbi:MAG: hypothetical protein PUP92_17075 [Rhizonema sp. PD38]|nr:hypothetical protein [Rhizonema sp. PD38]